MSGPLAQRSATGPDRVAAWLGWMHRTRTALAELDRLATPPELRNFLVHGYAANEPMLLQMPEWPALSWTLDSLKSRLGNVEVQVQAGRASQADYEIRSDAHRRQMRFADFIDRIANGPDNDVYLTAQNAHENRAALAPLFADLTPLPGFLTPAPAAGFLWLGGRTMTPLHHDLTNNLLCQVMGRKLVRMIRPLQVGRVDNHIHVHSRLGWVTDQTAAERGLAVRDVTLSPGAALFIPVGWWHCVQALDPSATVSFTNFIWHNDWTAGFPG